jgi:GNAT superfamily N-acetyltransferase
MPARHALRSDLPTLHAALEQAFAEDLLVSWLCPDPGPSRTTWFDVALRSGLRRGHTYCLKEAPEAGAAIWSPPDVGNLNRSEGAELAAALTAQYGEAGAVRLAATGAAVGAHHPTVPHFYLFVVGVSPSHRGRGAGAALLAPVLATCDAQGWPAYLESSHPRNVSFYERLGFRPTADIAIDGGPTLLGMWRDPSG